MFFVIAFQHSEHKLIPNKLTSPEAAVRTCTSFNIQHGFQLIHVNKVYLQGAIRLVSCYLLLYVNQLAAVSFYHFRLIK